MNPEISIIFTSYNHREYLSKAMDSLISQTFSNFEIIIVDDCSTDGSQEILRGYLNDSRVKLHILTENTGSYVKASNYGVKFACSDLILFAQCDDFAEPKQLETLHKYSTNFPNCAVYFSASNLIDNNGVFLNCDFEFRSREFRSRHYKDSIIPGAQMFEYLQNSCVIPNLSAALIRREVLLNYNLLSSDFLVLADWDFWLKVALKHDFFYVREALNNFRQHQTTIRNTVKLKVQVEEVFRMFYSHSSLSDGKRGSKLKLEYYISLVWLRYSVSNLPLWVRSFPSVYRTSLSYSKSLIFVMIYTMFYNVLKKIFFIKF